MSNIWNGTMLGDLDL